MWGNFFIFGVLFNLYSYSHGQLYLNVSSDTTDISITFNGLQIFEQTESSIIFILGTGTTEYHESQGNFVINDTVVDQFPLLLYEIIQANDTLINVRFMGLNPLESTVDFVLEVRNDTDGDECLFVSATTTIGLGDEGVNRLWMNIYGDASEKIYGAGEQYTYLNLKGHSFPIWTSEQGVGRDNGLIANTSNLDGGAGGSYFTTYWPSASFISNRGYSVMIANHHYVVLDFEDDAKNTIYSHSTDISGSFLFAPTIQTIVPKIARTLGTQPTLPDWVITGATLGLEGIDGGTEEILLRYEEAKEAGVNIAALWLQDWSGGIETSFGHRVYWNWKWNESYYKDLDVVIQDLLAEGVKMTVYINPHLIVDSEMYLDAEAGGFLMINKTGSVYQYDFGGFLGGTVDVFNPEARAWFKDQLTENILGLGICGWMGDFGEYTPLDMYSRTSGNASQEEIHNAFPVYWAKNNQELKEAASNLTDPEEVVYYMRSGSLGSSGHQMLAWGGDQNVDFSYGDGLPSTIVAALSLSVSGMGVSHFDIGGYTTQPPILKRSKELLLRSAEYAAFTPVMRTHLGNKPFANWQIYSSKETLQEFGRLTQIHARLLNYTKFLVQQNSQIGIPAQVPMFYYYQNDANTWDIQYQYMYGPDLIVAPSLNEGQMTVEVYIPEGDEATWYHIWDGISGSGGPFVGPTTVLVDAPIGLPAVMFRGDSEFRDLFVSINEDFGAGRP